jgi:hypothetical protein
MTSPDPVREAEAYRQSLLAALGGDDPAEAALELAAARPSAEDRGRRPGRRRGRSRS